MRKSGLTYLMASPRCLATPPPLQVSFCFIISLFFAPLLATIPPYATGPVLILVGSMMMINLKI